MSIDLSNYEIITDSELKHFNWRKPRDIELAAVPLINLDTSFILQVFRSVMFVLTLITGMFGFSIVLDFTITLFNSGNILSFIMCTVFAVFLASTCFMLGCVIVDELLFKLERQIKKSIKRQDFEILDVDFLGCYVDKYTDGDNCTISKVYTVVETQEGKVYLSRDSYNILDASKTVLFKVPIKTIFSMKSPEYTYFVVRY